MVMHGGGVVLVMHGGVWSLVAMHGGGVVSKVLMNGGVWSLE